MTSSAALKSGDFSRDLRSRCWFAVHRRARLRKKAPRAATACPAAVLPASGLALATDSSTVLRSTDKTEGGKAARVWDKNVGDPPVTSTGLGDLSVCLCQMADQGLLSSGAD